MWYISGGDLMDKNQADEYLKALVSAYVWAASADSGVDAIEIIKYEHVMAESQFATQFEASNIRRYFKDMVNLFSENYDSGIAITKDRLSKIRLKPHLTEEVIRVCRAAIISDGKIEEAEEIVLKEIALVLGVNTDG
jgi:tellurite resistance protein